MMLRRQALALGSLLLSACTLGGWTLFRQKGRDPLLLSARQLTGPLPGMLLQTDEVE